MCLHWGEENTLHDVLVAKGVESWEIRLYLRTKRWIKFFMNYIKEKIRGLDFIMVYAGEVQRTVEEFQEYGISFGEVHHS